MDYSLVEDRLKLQTVCREKSGRDGGKRSGRDGEKRRGRWGIYTIRAGSSATVD